MPVCLQIVVEMYLSEPMHRELSLIFTEITNSGTWNNFVEHVSTFTFNSLTWFCKLVQSAHIRYFYENSMIAHAALVLKDTFTPRFASMQSILDCGILGKFRGNSD